MKITFWSDYACPYCYIGEARFKKAVASIPEIKDIEIDMKAFRLDPLAEKHAVSDTSSRFAHKYGLSLADAEKRIESISQLGIAEGLDFKYATTRFTNTMDAHRLTKLAQSKKDPALLEKITEALFKAYFTDNSELADRGVLKQIGEKNGLDAAEIAHLFDTAQYIEEVISDEREAAGCNIRSVPFFAMGEYRISGAQTVEGMKATLRKVLEAETNQGLGCGVNGCKSEV